MILEKTVVSWITLVAVMSVAALGTSAHL